MTWVAPFRHSPRRERPFEVRMFGASSAMREDPIMGSLNAALFSWMYGSGYLRDPVTMARGTCINRTGRLFIRHDDAANIVCVGGHLLSHQGSIDSVTNDEKAI
jgi:predicted PhzF superfamily epimerase YddE/YHI9